MPTVKTGRLTKTGATKRRRSTSTVAKAKYAPKTANMNRKLIQQNAYAIKKIREMVTHSYCDFQYTSADAPFISVAPENYFNIKSVELMSPSIWSPVLRSDQNVLDSSSTLVKRMQMNLRLSLGQSNWCQMSVFIVSIRKDAADRDISQAGLVVNEDYIYNTENFNPRLNSQVFKVHYVQHASLMTAAWKGEKAVQGNSELIGNPNTTLRKSQVNMELNHRLRQPNGAKWKDMEQSQLAPNQRLHLLMFFKGNTNDVDDDPPRVDWDAQYVTYNCT